MRTFYLGFEALCSFIDRIARLVLVLLLVLIVVLVTGQVALRSTVGIPVFWIGELSGYAFAYVALLGAGVCLRSDSHVRVPLVLEKLPPAIRRALIILINLVAILYAYHLAWFGYRFAMLGASELSPTSTFILFWPRLALVIGGVLLALQATCLISRELFAPETERYGN